MLVILSIAIVVLVVGIVIKTLLDMNLQELTLLDDRFSQFTEKEFNIAITILITLIATATFVVCYSAVT